MSAWFRVIYRYEDETVEIVQDIKVESIGNPIEVVRAHPDKKIVVIDQGWLIGDVFVSMNK